MQLPPQSDVLDTLLLAGIRLAIADIQQHIEAQDVDTHDALATLRCLYRLAAWVRDRKVWRLDPQEGVALAGVIRIYIPQIMQKPT